MRIQSSHSDSDRGLDAYFTPPEATWALLGIEPTIPTRIWEPACGDGAISKILEADGKIVFSSDIGNYGFGTTGWDYLHSHLILDPDSAIVTNPPFKLAIEFAIKALSEVSYVALLLRTNFLESTSRLAFFRAHPPARVWISSRRLPMMHRHGWTGPEAPSNTCHAWFIWDFHSERKRELNWFDWQDYSPANQQRINGAELGL